ncbi:hypothetical protein I317_02032 [Kwoniella heveanensis CBS 569]|nr:hypothetical protein I317_02032 [Kwoniella heveanensis CBS 569]
MVNADATVTKRLHIGGLTPAITTTHIKDRFASFGKVSEVEEMQPDALGQPRPFTFLTIETTPALLKKCLNTLSGSFWRGTQLRLAEAKPRYTTLYPTPEPSRGEKAKLLEKKRKRVLSSRAEGVGKTAQDMRIVTPKIAAQKKFWVEAEGRIVRPIAVRPSHPIGVVVERTKSERKPRAPPSRSRRRVINPVQWGSSYLTAEQLPSDIVQQEEEGFWEYEEIEEDGDGVEDQEEPAEDGKVVLGIWRKTVKDEVVEEQVVRGKRRRVEQDSDYDYNFGSDAEEEDDEISLAQGGGASSPLFGTRHQALPKQEDEQSQGSASPLFPTRALGAPSPSSAAFPGSTPGLEGSTKSESEGDDEGDDEIEVVLNTKGRSASPLFPPRPEERTTINQPSSPLFPARSAPDLDFRQSPSPSSEEEDAPADRPASSPLFPSRALPSPAQPPQATSSKRPETTAQTARPKAPALPTQIVETARAEKSAALGVLGALLGDLSAPREKKGKMEWAGFAESEDEDGDEVEIARGRGKSAASEAHSTTNHDERDDILSINVDEPAPVIPVQDEGQVDASSSGEVSSSNSASGSSSSGSGSSSASSGEGDGGDGMDVDPPAGGSGSGSGSSSSGSGDGSDESDDDSEDDSGDSHDESDDESESDSEEEDEATTEKQLAAGSTAPPKPVGLKEMFAPGAASSSTATFGFGAGGRGGAGGFSLLADLEPDLELDEDMDIPLPSFAPTSGSGAAAGAGATAEEELQPLPLMSGTSGKGKVKLDANPDIPLFFALPTTQAQASASQSRKGEARNPYNELYTGVPVPAAAVDPQMDDQNGYGQYGRNGYGGGHDHRSQPYGHAQGRDQYGDDAMEQEGAVETMMKPLPAFVRQEGETDESMKKRWEAERVELTQGWKKKHREAKKQRRRKGGEDIE